LDIRPIRIISGIIELGQRTLRDHFSIRSIGGVFIGDDCRLDYILATGRKARIISNFVIRYIFIRNRFSNIMLICRLGHRQADSTADEKYNSDKYQSNPD